MRFAVRALLPSFAVLVMSVTTTAFLSNSAAGQDAAKGAAAPPSSSTPPASATPPAGSAPAAEAAPATGSTGLSAVGEASAKDLLAKGDAAIKAGDFVAAVGAYSEAVHAAELSGQDYPKDRAAALFGRARAFVGLKSYQPAIKDFGTLLTELPDDAGKGTVYVARGLAMLELNRVDDAQADFQKAVDLDFSNVDALFGLGKTLVLQGKVDDAIIPLTAVVTANPKNAEAFRFRGLAYSSLFKNKKALDDLQQAIQLNPDDYEAYLSLGIVNNRHEDYDKAAEAFGQAIQHYKPKAGQEDEPFQQGIVYRAMALIELGKKQKDPAAEKAAYQAAYDESQKLVAQFEPKNPAHAKALATALLARGSAERLLEQYGTAVRTFTQAIDLRTNSLPDEQTNAILNDLYFRRGVCFHKIGEDRMAVTDFQTAAHLVLDDPRANMWEGFMYASLGNYQEALRAYGDAIAASDRYTPAYYNRALSYMQLAEYDKAINDFGEAIRLDPTNAEFYFKRGIAFEQLADYQKASESFASAIEFDKTHAGAYRHMADALQRLGRTELVNQYRQKADELAPPKKSS